VAQKLDHIAPARDLYTSPLFRARRAYAERVAPRRWGILSAAWGFVHPDDRTPPYNRRLSDLPKTERWAWAMRAASLIVSYGFGPPSRLQVEIHAGQEYRVDLVPELRRRGVEVLEPLAGLGIGEQLHWYAVANVRQLELFA
jgi:hypothetical protein